MFGRLLGVWKRFDELAEQQRAHEWKATFGRSLAGSTMVVVGLGAIGTQVIRLAKAFGLHVVGRPPPARGRRRAPAGWPTRWWAPSDLLDVLPGADVVVIAAPATDDTRHLDRRARRWRRWARTRSS